MSELAPQLDFRVDAEFRDNIPPLSDAEYAELERLLINEGCLHPLIVWEGEGILVDGHHRLRICEQHGIDYEVKLMPFLSRTHALLWQLRHQRGRRNISDYQRDLMALREQELLSEIAREQQGTRTDLCPNWDKSFEPIHSWQQAAEHHGTSRGSMHRTALIEAKAPEPIKAKARAGELSRHAAYELTKALEDVPQDVIDVVTAWDITDAELVPLLMQQYRRKSDTWAEMRDSGYVQPGEEFEAVPLTAGAKAVSEAIQLKARTHQTIAHDIRRIEDAARVATVADALAVAGGARYQTVVIDPPWDWGDEGDVNQLGRARPTYATMPLDDIAALPIPEIADGNAHLYLWITNRSLPKGFGLIERWGFRYILALTWVKPHFGMGNYFRGSTEHVLFAVRGSLPLLRHDVGTHFTAPRGSGHSAKPDEFYELIETCSPGPRIDMFARAERPGWVTWGNLT